MSAGFQVWSQSGNFIQVTQDYANAILLRVQRVTHSNAGAPYATIYVVGANPFIGVYNSPSPKAGVSELSRTFDGTTWTITLALGGPWADIAIFDRAAVPSTTGSNAGVQVFKPNGTIAFDDKMPYMRVIATHTPPQYIATTGAGYSSTWQVALPHSKCAVLCAISNRFARRSFRSHDGVEDPVQIWLEACGVQGNIATLGWNFAGNTAGSSGTPSFTWSGGSAPMLIVVDLSLYI